MRKANFTIQFTSAGMNPGTINQSQQQIKKINSSAEGFTRLRNIPSSRTGATTTAMITNCRGLSSRSR